MSLQKIFILFLILLITLLSIPACTSNREGTNLPPADEAEENIEVLPPLEPLEKGNPKLGSYLWRLIEAEKQGEAESFAKPREIELVDGDVRVTIECLPGQLDAAAEAAIKAGAKLGKSYKNWLPAFVPITSLEALAEAESIRFIRVPERVVGGAE